MVVLFLFLALLLRVVETFKKSALLESVCFLAKVFGFQLHEFYLSEELVFKITLAEAKMIVKGPEPTNLAYELTKCQLEYEVMHSVNFAQEAESTYINGKQFMYDYVSHHIDLCQEGHRLDHQ